MSTRINTNVQALQSFSALQKTNNNLALRQMRLATGSQINRAEDDTAGYTIAKKLEAKVRGQAQALDNVADAKSMLTVGEGGLNSVMDILQTMKEKSVQAANDTLGTQERDAIKNQLDALRSEVSSVLSTTNFNGQALFSEDGTEFNFQVGAESGDGFTATLSGISADSLLGEVTTTEAEDATATLTAGTFGGTISDAAYTGAADQAYSFRVVDDDGTNSKLEVSTDGGTNWTEATSDAPLGMTGGTTSGEITVTAGDLSFKIDAGYSVTNGQTFSFAGAAATEASTSGGLSVDSHTNAQSAIEKIDAAINSVSSMLSGIGDNQTALSFKQENLETSMTNYDSAKSRIADADFAKEQMQIVKLQVLQQTGLAAMAQANAAPQSVLSLLR